MINGFFSLLKVCHCCWPFKKWVWLKATFFSFDVYGIHLMEHRYLQKKIAQGVLVQN
jgi:hypothetical protein